MESDVASDVESDVESDVASVVESDVEPEEESAAVSDAESDEEAPVESPAPLVSVSLSPRLPWRFVRVAPLSSPALEDVEVRVDRVLRSRDVDVDDEDEDPADEALLEDPPEPPEEELPVSAAATP
ncbi:MSCRAMM family adhesin SdrC [Mycolicibacterium palauense]|uniref:MSCRAMM family adhesin SdrC n=1 Tax=Mycolicibacterium palauense TaxID=2034511 RepID=UPI001FEC3C23|nr:MSCRAMM family adhesin SdrC [Mycolicibacterium palauense]